MTTNKKYSTVILLIVGIVLLLNVLAGRFFFRLDFTEDKRYTLSAATKDLLSELGEPVTVKAYFSKNLPPQLDMVRRDFRDMLVEYTQASDGMVVYEFIDPLKEENGEMQAQQAGIMQMQVQVREKDQLKAQIAYMGAVIELGENKESIPVIQSTSGMEYFLTSSIKKLAVVEKPLVGLLTGHGEAGMQEIPQAIRDLSVLYQVEDVSLTDTTRELARFSTLALIRPTDSLPEAHLEQLSEFVDQGGNLLVALNRVDMDMTGGFNMGRPIHTGLESWLLNYGIQVNDNFVLDVNAVTVMVSMQQGPFTVQQPMAFPYIPQVNNFGDHPVVGGLEQLVMTYVSSIDYTGDSTLNYTPLLLSSEMSATRPGRSYVDLGYQWTENDFPMSHLTLGAALEGKFGSVPGRMVVIADGNFPVAESQQQVNPDNVNLLVNGIDWLSDDTGLLELRTQGATARPIEEMEDGKKAAIKYINFLVPILLVIAYGIIRAQRNRILRNKRREVGYV
jgi:gliding-associated putative ABC transporter substrate-binding component GldG